MKERFYRDRVCPPPQLVVGSWQRGHRRPPYLNSVLPTTSDDYTTYYRRREKDHYCPKMLYAIRSASFIAAAASSALRHGHSRAAVSCSRS